MGCWQRLGQAVQSICRRICGTWIPCLWGNRASQGFPFFVCSALLRLHLFPFPLPPCASATAGHKGSMGTSGWIQQCQESRHGQLTQPGCPGPAGSACTPSTALHTPLVEDLLYTSARGRRVTMVLRVLECQTAAARARAEGISKD